VKKSFLEADADGSGFLDEDEFRYGSPSLFLFSVYTHLLASSWRIWTAQSATCPPPPKSPRRRASTSEETSKSRSTATSRRASRRSHSRTIKWPPLPNSARSMLVCY
jgi:hypothetical protein